MLSRSETETIRAALRYWRDEIAGHDDLARLYTTEGDIEPLAPDAIETLVQCFQRNNLQYIAVRRDSGRVEPTNLLSEQKLHKESVESDFLTVIVR